eukprot:1008908-Rhodomonas_salina.1
MPGTDIAYAAIGLPACYAVPGTDIVYYAICLRLCYAMPGTDIAYGATCLPGTTPRAPPHRRCERERESVCVRVCVEMCECERKRERDSGDVRPRARVFASACGAWCVRGVGTGEE